jgi:hypothetical protein
MYINNNISKKFVILTYPRAGSHYFQSYLYQKTSIYIEKIHAHSLINNRQPISIIRNPYDSLKSAVAMHNHFYAKNNKSLTDREVAQKYIDFYKNFNLEDSILIDYIDLISKPEKVILYFAKMFKVPVNNENYKNLLVDDAKNQYLVTSKKTKTYSEIEKYEIDFSECNDVYRKALSRCISV